MLSDARFTKCTHIACGRLFFTHFSAMSTTFTRFTFDGYPLFISVHF